jgi:uncharacterized protein YjbJ (UPF0337 family)
MMDQAKGAVKDVVGKAQDAYGGATGDAATQLQGKIRQATGKLQESYGEAVDGLREQTAANPIATLAVAAGVGFVLGALWSRRS